MSLKKILFLFIIVGVLIIYARYYYIPKKSPLIAENTATSTAPMVATIDQITYSYDAEHAVRLAVFKKPIELITTTRPTSTLKELATKENYRLVLNANYFTPAFTPAGFFARGNNIEVAHAPKDRQLNTIVTLSPTLRPQFFPAISFSTSTITNYTTDTITFQTGPLILNRNQVASSSITNSLNGEGTHPRTVLGYTESGKTIVAIVAEPRTLFETAELIKQQPPLAQEIVSLVNLDGGPSTAWYTADVPETAWGSYKLLPLLLGVR